ncbi:nucleotidyltransferase family protein [Deferribacter autotrophicus]|uniref:Nucleotidyltransferase family protein n=1 Tax=Deferribacter autotrophicus TaxID=500465 RepID=A0A5A8F2D7_9BACT|nr:nucleotidyltransferase family protein [Deferribacter autotrophicus]KAA0257649.1 nucleotidyltransferase family protein [Deferribacter autotrophicus]
MEEIVRKLKKIRKFLEKEYYVKDIALFGSYVRGEQDENSDLDILVDFYKTPTLLQFLRLKYFLSDYLSIKVDLVMKQSLKPVIGKRIIREAISI